ncbi:MAG TPA: thioesterase [Bacteroidales bacterium]|nr:thioesterase [Bacteroidales bacterium]
MMLRDQPHRSLFMVQATDTDAENRLKISSIFNYLQIVSGRNANELSFGYDDLSKKGLFWVLSRMMLEWHGKIGIEEEIIVETWPKGTERLFALRDFMLYYKNGKPAGKATSAWLLIDINTRRPVIPSQELFNRPEFNIPPAIDELPEKITEPHEKELLTNRKVVYSDLDINHHVNNAKYPEYIFDALPQEIADRYKDCKFQINYLKELRLGEIFNIYYSKTDTAENQYYIDAENELQQKVFQATLEFG